MQTKQACSEKGSTTLMMKSPCCSGSSVQSVAGCTCIHQSHSNQKIFGLNARQDAVLSFPHDDWGWAGVTGSRGKEGAIPAAGIHTSVMYSRGIKLQYFPLESFIVYLLLLSSVSIVGRCGSGRAHLPDSRRPQRHPALQVHILRMRATLHQKALSNWLERHILERLLAVLILQCKRHAFRKGLDKCSLLAHARPRPAREPPHQLTHTTTQTTGRRPCPAHNVRPA
jgi:hypothetical protein